MRSISASTHGQFLLQGELGLLIVGVGKLAHAIFELQIAQILINRAFALRDAAWERRGRAREVLGANGKRKQRRGGHDDDHRSEQSHQSSFARSFSMRSMVAGSIGGIVARLGLPEAADHESNDSEPQHQRRIWSYKAHHARRDRQNVLAVLLDKLIQDLLSDLPCACIAMIFSFPCGRYRTGPRGA